MYYSLFCRQYGEFMATGGNSHTVAEVKAALLSYLSADHDNGQLAALEAYAPDDLADLYDFDIVAHEERRPERYS